MKRTLLQLTALVAAFFSLLPANVSAQTQDNALYVYRNDGDFTAFLREDIDSIVLSHLDADSVWQQEFVMQEFHTPDSVYRIPISAIDSVSLVPVPTIVNSDVFPLTAEHNPYILRGDTLSFEFSTTTPSDLLPSKGNIVVSSYDCDAFEDGILARVVSIDKQDDALYYVCEKAYLDDVFDQVLYVGDLTSEGNTQSNSAKSPTNMQVRKAFLDWDSEKELWNESYENTLEKGGTTTQFSANDAATVRFTFKKVHILDPLYVQIRIKNKIETSVTFNAKDEYENSYELPLGNTLRVGKIPVPGLPVPVFFIPTFDFYGYFSTGGELNLDFAAHLNRSDNLTMTYSNGAWTSVHNPNNDVGVDVASLSMSGYAEIGIKADILLALSGTRTGVGLTAKAGLKESIDCKFDALEYVGSGLYSAIKDSYARTTIPWSVDAFASVGLIARDCPQWHTPALSGEPQWGSDKYILPLFSQPEYTAGASNSTAVITTSPSRDLLMPVSLGIGLENEDGEAVETKWNSVEYQKETEWTLNGESESFSDLAAGTYTAYPYVRILGQELRAEPSCEFETGKANVELSDFTIDSRQYSENAFTNDGSTYDYKFECSVTATLDYGGDVDDWGYVYEDPNGNKKMISLSAYGSPYTDSRYAYYRNSVPSTVRLYGYVLPSGKSEYVYDEPQDFDLTMQTTCPDNNHVHLIDLGLPSGTKWACCNVGASSPEGYGGYYAWGETEEKSDYDSDTYAYSIYDSDGDFTWECTNIGSDIAGTSYDVAHVKWGGSWHMPTLTQIKELLNYCSWTWTTQNGVNGRLVTGPNGNSIFLPAAGYRGGASLNDAGSDGNYWSSTAAEYYSYYACYLYFSSGNISWYYNCRDVGQSVRPVSE